MADDGATGNLSRFTGRVLAITGGSSGIGEAIATRLVAEGALVAVIDLEQRNPRVATINPENLAYYQGNVVDAEQMKAAFDRIVDRHGRLDGLVNGAGVRSNSHLTAGYPLDEWRHVMATNLDGAFHSLRAAIPHMAHAGRGSIVNISSITGMVGLAGHAPYVASKHALIGLTKTVALEYGPSGIRCNAVCPTFVRTPMTMQNGDDPELWRALDARHPIGRCATSREVAALAVFLLSDEAAAITGSAHLVDGGFMAS